MKKFLFAFCVIFSLGLAAVFGYFSVAHFTHNEQKTAILDYVILFAVK